MRTTILAFIIAALQIGIASAQDLPSDSTDYTEVAAAIEATMHTYHYNPAELDNAAYQTTSTAVAEMAKTASSDEAFIAAFREIWQEGPFSHVVLNKASGTADDLAAYLDNLRIGGGGAVLAWRNDVAILTVNTMMGLDTIEEIDAAYDEIAARGATSLVIDLRANGGGAFAIKPLVSHLIDQPYIAGGFVSQRWNAANDEPPARDDMEKVDPWEGWSIRTFWADAQEQSLTVVKFLPQEPVFTGPVYVLTSERTASAAELAADALKGAGRAQIIGENTAGEMLSQKIYDIPGGFHLSLPIADYYSAAHGRIEGTGVAPEIPVKADDAMAQALDQK